MRGSSIPSTRFSKQAGLRLSVFGEAAPQMRQSFDRLQIQGRLRGGFCASATPIETTNDSNDQHSRPDLAGLNSQKVAWAVLLWAARGSASSFFDCCCYPSGLWAETRFINTCRTGTAYTV